LDLGQISRSTFLTNHEIDAVERGGVLDYMVTSK